MSCMLVSNTVWDECLQHTSTQDEYGSDTPIQLNENILLLQSIWRSEYHAPEILPYQEELVEQIKNQLEAQQV